MNEMQIKCFIEAAQCSSFTEASEKIYITLPTFGRYISSLETELGYPLFVRGRKKLQLTEIGELMYEGFLEIAAKMEKLKEEAEKISTGITGQLHIAILEGQHIDAKLLAILQYFRKNFKNLQVMMHRYSFQEMNHLLLTGELDLGITLTVEIEHYKKLEYIPYQSLKNYIVLPRKHILARKEPLKLIDLKDVLLLELASEECHYVSMQMHKCCAAAGFQPKVEKYPNLQAQLFALEAGLGMMALNENHSACRNPNLIAREVAGLPAADFCVAWNSDNTNPAITSFLERI